MGDVPVIRGRERVRWLHSDRGKARASWRWVWWVVEPDGYERAFDTKREAQRFVAEW